MLQPRIQRPLAVIESLFSSSSTTTCSLSNPLNRRHLLNTTLKTFLPRQSVRYAGHAAQGRANGPKDSAGRRLGAKKTDSQYVIPGNIIFRQRGSKWFPGENVGMGKDHTIYATEYGYVRYYRDPNRHSEKKYIGVSLAREGKNSMLPTPPTAARPRRLNMVVVPRKLDEVEAEMGLEHFSGSEDKVRPEALRPKEARLTRLGPRYTYRESNYAIGKVIELAREKVHPYRKGDRFLAWRKKAAKVKRVALLRSMKANQKGKAKAKKSQRRANKA